MKHQKVGGIIGGTAKGAHTQAGVSTPSKVHKSKIAQTEVKKKRVGKGRP